MVKGLQDKSIGGKGQKVAAKYPHKVCLVCHAAFDFREGEPIDKEKLIEKEHLQDPCADCKTKLDEGYIAFVHGDRFAFAKSQMLKDMAGTVQHLSANVFETLATQFKLEWKVKEHIDHGPKNSSN